MFRFLMHVLKDYVYFKHLYSQALNIQFLDTFFIYKTNITVKTFKKINEFKKFYYLKK